MLATSWRNIGTDVTDVKSIGDVMSKAGLDFQVEKVPIFCGTAETGLTKYDQKVATRIVGTNKILGVVGKDYQICQNHDAFEFANYIGGEMTYERAGITKGGMVYIIAKLNSVNVLGDEFTPYLIYSNGFNGGYQIRTAISPLRIVCTNQFNITFQKTQNAVFIKHSNLMSTKMEDAKRVLRATADYMYTLNETAEKYAGVKIGAVEAQGVIDEMFPINAEVQPDWDAIKIAKKQEQIEAQKQMFLSAYNAEDNQNFRGTAWGLINAASDYYSHLQPKRKVENWEENRFAATVYDFRALNAFMEIIQSRVA